MKTLLLFWFFCLVFIKWPVFESKPVAPSLSSIILEPLTIQEKMLFGFPLPMNQFSAQDWEAFPHVGPKLAQKIVDYQRRKGPFKNLEELLEVPGVGPKTLESMAPFLRREASDN